MNKPKKVTFVAPSYLLDEKGEEKIRKATEILEEHGFEISIAKHVKESDTVTPLDKANDLIDAFNSDSDIVWSVGGGEGMINTMKCLDFDKIKDTNKLFIGFSDNTCLTYTLVTMFDKPSIVGYNGKRMSYDLPDRNDLFRMLNDEKEFKSYDYWDNEENNSKKPDIEFINYEEPVTGILLGGCVEVLKELQDAGLDNTINYLNRHKNENLIFFLDNDGSVGETLKNNLQSFKEAGWFDQVSMFICSRSYKYYDDKVKEELNQAYLDVLGTFNKPIVLNADIGHMEPLMPLYIGKKCKVSKDNKTLTIIYE